MRAAFQRLTSRTSKNPSRLRWGGLLVASSVAVGAAMFYPVALAKEAFVLAPLPYAKNALEPHISAETIEFHYEKHHRGYLTKLNAMAAGTPLESQTLEQIILTDKSKAFNLAAQIWNHTFYWESMSPNGGGIPTGKLAEEINNSFGSFENFKNSFNVSASGHFGSGWTWLVRDKTTNKLSIVETHDAGNPIVDGKVPLLTCDVWEHAYYIDKRNDRVSYINAWWNVVDWKAVEKRLL
eukprot:TRINITY_DN4072_c0_g1_i2.p1 TRINITY_DN4072_c0_g1~~TRINITY_DN4072_c0_g1_i2.p1  ORF type:complete len:238 (-),score=40.05 TRINITY_DN4072_c0_g1_i2:80-793(-)